MIHLLYTLLRLPFAVLAELLQAEQYTPCPCCTGENHEPVTHSTLGR